MLLLYKFEGGFPVWINTSTVCYIVVVFVVMNRIGIETE